MALVSRRKRRRVAGEREGAVMMTVRVKECDRCGRRDDGQTIYVMRVALPIGSEFAPVKQDVCTGCLAKLAQWFDLDNSE